MARPERNNVDYFPFLCKEGKAMYYIEQRYGNDGYATWIKILRQLAVSNYHYINLSDRVEFMFLASKCRVSEEVLSSIISDLCDLGEFHKELWTETKVIFSEKFINNIKDAYFKRTNNCITLQGLLLLLKSLGVNKLPKSTLSTPVNPHTILDNTILDNSILDNSIIDKEGTKKFVPPTIDEVINYFNEKGYSTESGRKAFEYYNVSGWKDSRGKPVKNWKQKMQGVWFKDENKTIVKVVDTQALSRPMTDEEYEQYVRPKLNLQSTQ